MLNFFEGNDKSCLNIRNKNSQIVSQEIITWFEQNLWSQLITTFVIGVFLSYHIETVCHFDSVLGDSGLFPGDWDKRVYTVMFSLYDSPGLWPK